MHVSNTGRNFTKEPVSRVGFSSQDIKGIRIEDGTMDLDGVGESATEGVSRECDEREVLGRMEEGIGDRIHFIGPVLTLQGNLTNFHSQKYSGITNSKVCITEIGGKERS